MEIDNVSSNERIIKRLPSTTVIEIDKQTAEDLSGLLTAAVYFDDNEWASKLYEALNSASDTSYSYSEDDGVFKKDE